MPFLKVPDANLFYDRAGTQGPCVLLVQGVGCVGEGWRPQIDDLSRDHQVAWLDNRGIGQSVPCTGPVTIGTQADDCLRLLDHLGWSRAHLVGHSMGGVIVQDAARAHPEKVASLSLMSTVRRGRDAAIPSWANLKISLGLLFGSERERWLKAAALPFPAPFLARLPDDEKLRLVQMIFCRDFLTTPPVVKQQLGALFRHTGGESSALRHIPTLIVTGGCDIVVSTRYSDDLHSYLPGSRLERFPDAGHGVPLSHSTAVSQLVRDHVRRAP